MGFFVLGFVEFTNHRWDPYKDTGDYELKVREYKISDRLGRFLWDNSVLLAPWG